MVWWALSAGPNHESATDSGGNNVYDIAITATEVGNTHTVTKSVAVTVTDVGDVAPSFTSASSATFDENGTGAVYTALVTPDVTGASISYSISGGADSAKFSINNSGIVSFKSSPDFENPTDSGANNIYDIVITAAEANNTFIATHSVMVTVNDVDDSAPKVKITRGVQLEAIGQLSDSDETPRSQSSAVAASMW